MIYRADFRQHQVLRNSVPRAFNGLFFDKPCSGKPFSGKPFFEKPFFEKPLFEKPLFEKRGIVRALFDRRKQRIETAPCQLPRRHGFTLLITNQSSYPQPTLSCAPITSEPERA